MKTFLKKYGRSPVVHWNENTKHTYEELAEMVSAILNDDVREYPNIEDTQNTLETCCFEWIKQA